MSMRETYESSQARSPGVRMQGQPIIGIVNQHADEAAAVRAMRTKLLRTAHVRLRDLARFDERLAAHLDGLAVAGNCARLVCDAALERAAAGEAFVAGVRALEEGDRAWLGRLLALGLAVPSALRGVLSAFGWVSPGHLRGTVRDLLGSPEPAYRWIGAAACAMHRVDPGLRTSAALQDPDERIRARALRTAGELGRRDVSAACLGALDDTDETCRFWASWSAVLLGDRERAVHALLEFNGANGPLRKKACELVLCCTPVAAAHGILQRFAADPDDQRLLIRGAGEVGDPAYVAWLIDMMNEERMARLAGEAFSRITGLDLWWTGLDCRAPSEFEPDISQDGDVIEMDEDDGLPWPNQEKIRSWWNDNSRRFEPGVRHFMGEPVNRENCLRVLKEGYQRQRIAAAIYLALLNPGTPLFEWRAPAWRQQRLLAQMT